MRGLLRAFLSKMCLSRKTLSRKTLRIRLLGIGCLFFLPLGGFAGDFPRVEGPCNLHFPADHGPHRDFRTEWWYYTGNLHTEAGRDFGYQLTFFRSRLIAPGRVEKPGRPSAWRTEEVWMAHAAVSDIMGKKHYHAARLMREDPGFLRVREDGEGFGLEMGSWALRLEEGAQHLAADAGDFSFHLDLVPEKPLVRHGDQGYSLKGKAPERASCYYSFTRLKTRGRLRVAGGAHEVRGLSWMDHEFSSEPLDPDAAGWDWFSIQLSDGYDLMLFQVRAKDGTALMLSGTLVGPAGESRALPAGEMALTPLSTWQSPVTGGLYPASWRLELPELSLALGSRLGDQEMGQEETPGAVVYWEGSIAVTGLHKGHPVTGKGYAELTGYAGSMAGKL